MEEKIIDSWGVDYISQNGEKYKGQLTITNNRLMYDLNITGTPKSNDDKALFVQIGGDRYVMIAKEDINTIIISKKLFKKRVTIELNNRTKHIFDCGNFNIDSIAKAISNL